MKKILLTACIGISAFMQAQQFTVSADDQVIENGQIIQAEELGHEMNIKVTNTGSEAIKTKIRVLSMENASGGDLQLCFGGTCYANIVSGGLYPTNYSVNLQPGADNGKYDHFINNYNGDNTNAPVRYRFELIVVDDNGNQVGDGFKFGYTFRGLGVENISETKDFQLNTTMVSDFIAFTTKKSGSVEIYSVNGQKVKAFKVEAGSHQVNFNSLNKGVYIINFVAEGGKSTSYKVMKK